MGSWGLTGEGGRSERSNLSLGSSLQASVSTHATANTKGAWYQLTGGLAYDCEGFWLFALAREVANQDYDALMDVAVGAAGSEKVVVSNWSLCCGNNPFFDGGTFFPFPIPAGQAVSVRGQSSTGGQTLDVGATFVGSGWGSPGPACGRVTTYGDATGDSGGMSVDPGGTINTKGSWVEIVASLTNPVRAAVVALGNQANAARTGAHISLDVGIGAASSEVVLIPDLSFRAGGTTNDVSRVNLPYAGPFAVEIPAGTRVAARAQCSNNDATDRLFDVLLYCLD